MKPRVVVSLLNSGQEFQLMQAAGASATGRRMGIGVEFVFAENNALEHGAGRPLAPGPPRAARARAEPKSYPPLEELVRIGPR